MKKLIAMITLIAAATASAAVYRLENVTRKDQDVYTADYGRLLIKTRYCYEYVSYETALYDDSTRKIHFRNGGSCEVAGIYRY